MPNEAISMKPIMFDANTRHMLVNTVLERLAAHVTQASNGSVYMVCVDYSLAKHEFAVKVTVSKKVECSRQTWSEVKSFVTNAIDYIFPASSDSNDSSFDVSMFTTDSEMEVNVVSNW